MNTRQSYFVVMIDHGERGLEAVVHPEDTRRAIVERLASYPQPYVFIHHVIEGFIARDVTEEISRDVLNQIRADRDAPLPGWRVRGLYDNEAAQSGAAR